jgi:hypothetical protein
MSYTSVEEQVKLLSETRSLVIRIPKDLFELLRQSKMLEASFEELVKISKMLIKPSFRP